MISKSRQKIAILGASRGFGRAFALTSWSLGEEDEKSSLFLASRNQVDLERLRAELLCPEARGENSPLEQERAQKRGNLGTIELLSADFSTQEGQERTLENLEIFCADKIFYFAGGGPYGAYEKKAWKDHLWAWQVTFLFAARLVHWAMLKGVDQVILVGSAIAENKGDPRAASYCSAKHALLGLFKSLNLEKPDFDLRLFSPPYLDTDLLPPNASPRQSGRLKSPEEMATHLWQWSQSDSVERHLVMRA